MRPVSVQDGMAVAGPPARSLHPVHGVGDSAGTPRGGGAVVEGTMDVIELRMEFPGGMRVTASGPGLRVATDQPVSSGGVGSAPSPFDLFLVSLGTCSAFYVLNFLQKRDLPTAGLGVDLIARREPPGGPVRNVEIRVALPAGFPAKYEQAVLRAIDHCAVKRALAEPPAVQTVLVAPESRCETALPPS